MVFTRNKLLDLTETLATTHIPGAGSASLFRTARKTKNVPVDFCGKMNNNWSPGMSFIDKNRLASLAAVTSLFPPQTADKLQQQNTVEDLITSLNQCHYPLG